MTCPAHEFGCGCNGKCEAPHVHMIETSRASTASILIHSLILGIISAVVSLALLQAVGAEWGSTW